MAAATQLEVYTPSIHASSKANNTQRQQTLQLQNIGNHNKHGTTWQKTAQQHTTHHITTQYKQQHNTIWNNTSNTTTQKQSNKTKQNNHPMQEQRCKQMTTTNRAPVCSKRWTIRLATVIWRVPLSRARCNTSDAHFMCVQVKSRDNDDIHETESDCCKVATACNGP